MHGAYRVLDRNRPDQTVQKLCALAVMTKAPRAGQVKTRLTPPLTPDEAAQLNKCFLRDTAATIMQVVGNSARGIAVYTPVGAETAYVDILPPGFDLLPQRGNDFGERLANAADDLFRIGFGAVCLIDSDSPAVRAEAYAQAVKLLSAERERVVLGPAEDGGYYLIGSTRTERRLFDGIDWSTERVLEQTIERARDLNLQLELLPTGYDVDDRAALRRLCEELLAADRPTDVAPATTRFLREIIARKGRAHIWGLS